MAIANGVNPDIPGPIKAQGFVVPYTPLRTVMTQAIHTSGVTRLAVFNASLTNPDAPNPFWGTFVGMKIIAKDTAAGTVTLKNNVGGTETTLATVAKGLQGCMNGCAFINPVGFVKDGTATVQTSGDTVNALVEILFTVDYPN